MKMKTIATWITLKMGILAVWALPYGPLLPAEKETDVEFHSKNTYTLSGTISHGDTGQSITYATVGIVEIKVKTRADEEGRFSIELPGGQYTLIVNSPGMNSHTQRVSLQGDTRLEVVLQAPALRGAAITIEGERDLQKVSRYTMGRQEIKEVPATFGDAMGAVATMAGIERQGLFGTMSVRGLGETEQRFYVDGIPVRKPQHFGGFHSIINNEFIDEIDIYSSAFPSSYGAPIGSVFEFNTLDEVKEKDIYLDISAISSNVTILWPIYFRKPHASLGETSGDNQEGGQGQEAQEAGGYWIIGGRYGYITLIAPLLASSMTGDGIDLKVYYYDYQLKGKYYINKNNSLTLLFFGGADSIDFNVGIEPKKKDELIEDGADPFFMDVDADRAMFFHTQSIMHTYSPSPNLKNTLKLYSALNKTEMYMKFRSADVADWAKNLNNSSRPNIYGLKDDLSGLFFGGLYGLKGGVEFTLYDFRASGKSVTPIDPYTSVEPGAPQNDLGNNNNYRITDLDIAGQNTMAGGYIENRLFLRGFELAGGVRGDYLSRQEAMSLDPRGRLTYTSPYHTTLSLAGGRYSSFVQTNFYYFDIMPNIIDSEVDPEKAVHRSAGVEQRFLERYTLKGELYYNTFSDLIGFQSDAANPIDNMGKRIARGVEVSLKREAGASRLDYYGWINYTYGFSELQSNNPADPLAKEWISADFDRRHSLKAVAGLRYGANLWGARFQYYSAFPETPIVGDDGGIPYSLDGQPPLDLVRYGPVYGQKNSRYRDPSYQLDLRYSRRKSFRSKEGGSMKGGYMKWYVEFINVTNFRPKDTQNWAYNKPFDGGSNPTYGSTSALALLPNFGVEIMF